MKKIWKLLFLVTLGLFTLNSCEDVPSPYPYPTVGGNDGANAGEAIGEGTLANPYNSVAAANYAKSLGGEESPKDVYIKGKVVSVSENYSTQFGNATFTISDDGTSAGEFTVYRALYLGNKKYTKGDQLKPGDEVIVCGKVVNFMGNTPETVQGKAYLLPPTVSTAARCT